MTPHLDISTCQPRKYLGSAGSIIFRLWCCSDPLSSFVLLTVRVMAACYNGEDIIFQEKRQDAKVGGNILALLWVLLKTMHFSSFTSLEVRTESQQLS